MENVVCASQCWQHWNNFGTTVDGFWQSSQKAQRHSSLLSLEHIAFCIPIGQPEPGAVDFNSFISITSDQIRFNNPPKRKISEDVSI